MGDFEVELSHTNDHHWLIQIKGGEGLQFQYRHGLLSSDAADRVKAEHDLTNPLILPGSYHEGLRIVDSLMLPPFEVDAFAPKKAATNPAAQAYQGIATLSRQRPVHDGSIQVTKCCGLVFVLIAALNQGSRTYSRLHLSAVCQMLFDAYYV